MESLLRLLAHPNRRRTIPRPAFHVAVAILAVAAATPPLWPGSHEKTVGAALQLARAARVRPSRQTLESDDRGAELDKPLSTSKTVRSGSGFKTSPGGYSPQRVHRFWSHYHHARPGPKEKPLEASPRDHNK
jgi:hypothetical protein